MELSTSLQYISVIISLAGVIGALVFSRIRPLVIFSVVVTFLYVTGVISFEVLSINYVNSSLLTLVVLLLLSLVLEKTVLLSYVARKVVQGGLKSILFRLGLFSGITSAFLNNTAVVAALMGPLRKQSGMLGSKLLLPLSYASILGGMLTLIGTSTNLIVNSFIDQTGMQSFGFLDFTVVGGVVFVVCLLVLVFVSGRLLPSHPLQNSDADVSEYFLERIVSVGSSLIGRSVAENGLRNLEKLYLVDIIRHDAVISPVGPEEVIKERDILVFSGDPGAVFLLEDIEGLESQENHQDLIRHNLVEVVVSPSSILLGRTVRESDFRSRFDAAVVAVRRGESRIEGGLGRLELRAGDELVLAVGPDFKARDNLARNFVIVGGVENRTLLGLWPSVGVIGGFLTAIGLAAVGVVSFFKALLVLLVLFVALKLVSLDELRRRFPFELVLVIGGALGLAQAMVSTGVAADIASLVNGVFGSFGVYGAYVGVFVVTWLLTELVTNNAAAALVFPVALSVAQQWGVSPYPFFMAVAFGARASFLSPYGYQTNLMVFSVGRYSIRDYFRAGAPVLVAYSVTAVLMIPVVFPF